MGCNGIVFIFYSRFQCLSSIYSNDHLMSMVYRSYDGPDSLSCLYVGAISCQDIINSWLLAGLSTLYIHQNILFIIICGMLPCWWSAVIGGREKAIWTGKFTLLRPYSSAKTLWHKLLVLGSVVIQYRRLCSTGNKGLCLMPNEKRAVKVAGPSSKILSFWTSLYLNRGFIRFFSFKLL